MRYLYGDSVLSPVQFNFLPAFESFVDAAVQASRFDRDAIKAKAKIEADAEALQNALELVEDFHVKAMNALEDLLAEYDDKNTSFYVELLRDAGDGVVEQARNACQNPKDRITKELGIDNEARRKEIMMTVERCLKSEVVPIIGWSCSMRLTETHPQFTSEFSHPGRITPSYLAKPTSQSPWNAPVRVGSIVPGIELQIGVKKSWITGSVAKGPVLLDDFIIGGFDIGDDTAEIRLRKRPEQPDAIVFKLDRKGEDLKVTLERKGEDDAENGAGLDTAERATIERLWQTIRKSIKSTLNLRVQLVSVRIDGQDFLSHGDLQHLLQPLIKSIAPMVQGIIAHSPNPAELSMKLESEEGKREEIYVRRETLAAKITTLDEHCQSLFAPFGLTQEALSSSDLDVPE